MSTRVPDSHLQSAALWEIRLTFLWSFHFRTAKLGAFEKGWAIRRRGFNPLRGCLHPTGCLLLLK